MHILFRVLMIHVGILAACFVAALALVTIETWALPIPGDITREKAHEALLVHTVILGMVGLFFSYLPSVALGLTTEIFRIRSILFYAAVGAAIGLIPAIGILPHWITVENTGGNLIASPLKAFPAIGVIGGCLYWLVTGCRAGFSRTPRITA
jgi:hypothetical protein